MRGLRLVVRHLLWRGRHGVHQLRDRRRARCGRLSARMHRGTERGLQAAASLGQVQAHDQGERRRHEGRAQMEVGEGRSDDARRARESHCHRRLSPVPVRRGLKAGDDFVAAGRRLRRQAVLAREEDRLQIQGQGAHSQRRARRDTQGRHRREGVRDGERQGREPADAEPDRLHGSDRRSSSGPITRSASAPRSARRSRRTWEASSPTTPIDRAYQVSRRYPTRLPIAA